MPKQASTRRPRREAQDDSPASAPPRSRQWLEAAVVFAVALAARALHFWLMRDSVLFDVLICDSWQYDRWAQQLAEGDWLGSEVFYQTPLYPYFLGAVYAVFGHSVWAVRAIQAIGGSLACVFAVRAGAGFFSHRVGLLTGLMLALYPPAIFFDGILQKAALDLFFMTALLWVVAAAQRQPRAWLLGVAGVLLGTMTLNRENAAVLVPLLLAWAVWLSWDGSAARRLVQPAALALGIALVLIPVGARNYYVGGQFLLTTSQMGPNFYIGNHAGASGRYEPLRPGRGDPRHESADARLLAEAALARPLSPAEISDYWMDRSWKDVLGDPAAWMRLLAWKWFLTWNTLELVDAESIRIHARESRVLAWLGWVLHFGVLCPLAAAGIWFTRARWRQLWVLYAMLIVFAAAVALFYVFARYRYPLVPVTALFAAAGLAGFWDRMVLRDAARVRELAIAGALAAGAAIACNWPLPQLYDDDVTYFTAGTALLDDRRPADAIDAFQEAVKINPRSAATFNNLGRAALELQSLDDAQEYFERAVKLDPMLSPAYFGLGEVAEKRHDVDAAIDWWKRAVKVDPRLTIAIRALARGEMARGDPAAAVPYFRNVLKWEPDSEAAHADLAIALAGAGNVAEAIDVLRAGVKLAVKSRAANNLAWILATCPDESLRNVEESLALSEKICRMTDYKVPELLDTLAAAKANAGQFDEAARYTDDAIRLAREEKNTALVEALQQRRTLYLERQPFRDPELRPKHSSP